MKTACVLIAAAILTGCATQSGVVPAGDNTFTVFHQGAGAWVSSAELRANALKEAGQFCDSKQKPLKVIHTKEVAAGIAQFPQAEIQFTCTQ
jgi:hypothetical protein